ncbi:hypothetical protein ARMSODRAFT_982574 [Armillaria solidipes]|uniref:Uncharacterized protein n=1 Tax=Armillaria solidipes TaxID=1076256 RepID=A0A2H3AMQ1_9AGAR|nr:hypothetical protein ARMSODRAFT_982574 [Armillaria solidipes]
MTTLMASNETADLEYRQENVPAENCCISLQLIFIRLVGFFLSPWLYLCWLEILVVDFEQAIIDNKFDKWLETIYAAWYACWSKNPFKIYCDEEEKDDIAQQRQTIMRGLAQSHENL